MLLRYLYTATMRKRTPVSDLIVKRAGYITIAFIISLGLALTAFELQPFWLDEWFIIYNLKFKDTHALWGQLDYMQQFPRVYLQLLKQLTSALHYSYTSLRITSFIVHSSALLLCISLGKKLFNKNILFLFLWVMLYASFRTSTEYFVQVKQYTMEMLLALVAIWQLLVLQKQNREEDITPRNQLLFYGSLLIAPFFSYTYPIAVAPLFIIAVIHFSKTKRISNIIPLILSALSIVLFYILDVQQVMSDKGMQDYWQEYSTKGGYNIGHILHNLYRLFANLGSGALFEIIFASLGIAGLIAATIKIKHLLNSKNNFQPVVAYSALLIWLTIALYFTGKLPVGSHRLNAFATPALATLCLYSLHLLHQQSKLKKGVTVFAYILFLAVTANVYSSYINDLSGDKYKRKLGIYNHTKKGIIKAQDKHLPIFVNKNVAYPYHSEIEADWVIKTYPVYKVKDSIPVYPVSDSTHIISKALYLDADTMFVLHNN